MRAGIREILLLVAVLLAALAHVEAVAATDEDDEIFQSVNRASVEKARQRMYPGARDEQNLEIQPSLPQPSRAPDGTSTASAEAGNSAPPAHD